MDELRDYRFYARDMCHPSDVAVDIIWERFQQTFMSDATREVARQQERLWRQRQHRPLHE
ncbi:MAG: GSCFA domain-containing protein [Bacteroidales bacterium]|nr:GSCFA domain-containing protein [Bacteroidales bacterium]